MCCGAKAVRMAQPPNGSGPSEQPIETASAPTSPDNANSGYFAYIITGVAIVLLTVMTLGFTTCTGYLMNEAIDEIGDDWDEAWRYYRDYDFDREMYGFDDEFIELLENEGFEPGRSA